MAAKKKKTEVEWVGGLAPLDVRIIEEGEDYVPEVLAWMSPTGAMLGHSLGGPGELLSTACAHLRATLAKPAVGRPHTPARVRVASPELAEVLRAGHPGIEIVCAPTPEFDALLADMFDDLDDDDDGEDWLLASDVTTETLASFFRSSARLFRAKPWKTVPTSAWLISVTIERLGVSAGALSVLGQAGHPFGLLLFATVDDFDAYQDAADALELADEGEELPDMPPVPPHLVLSFEPRAHVSEDARGEIAKQGFELASADAYPRLRAWDADMVERPATAADFAILDALAGALPSFLAKPTPAAQKKALLAAWEGGEPVARTLTVATHLGEVTVSLLVAADRDEAPDDLLATLRALEAEGDENDAEERALLEDEMLARFLDSPEGKALPDARSCELVMGLANDYFGATVATLDAAELHEIVFELIPKNVSIEASAARGILEETRAFYTFLGRELGLEQAPACLRVLGGDAVKRLETALSDPTQFGLAKSLMMRGRDAGYDLDTKEGLEAWMRVVQSQPLPSSIPLPSPQANAAKRPADRASARTKKNAQKAARKKNR
jgi:hypothetical protein